MQAKPDELHQSALKVVQFIKTKTEELNANNSNEVLSKYIEMLSNTICECVIATNQTYVEALKKQGKFDAEAQKKAFTMTLNAVMNIMGKEAILYLNEACGDLSIYISNLIEAEVKAQKVG